MQNLVYFVLPEQTVYFQQIMPKRAMHTSEIIEGQTQEAILNALKYKMELNYLGRPYEKVIVPCIPALEHQLAPQNIGPPQLPSVIKVPYKTEIQGYASGVRSGIIIKESRMLRYKGCGNNTEGFIQLEGEPRGFHFFHTAKRELYMTEFINSILRKRIGIQSANTPLFFYQFGPEVEMLNLKYELPLVPKYCCVFETIGDRRAGTHIISPLEILFLNLCDCDCLDWFRLFSERGRIDENQPVEFLANWQLFLLPGQKFLQKLYTSKEINNYIDLRSVQIPDRKDAIDQLILIGETYAPKKLEEIKQLAKGQLDWKEAITIIIERAGWEMGQVKRIFCEEEINWGFFNDHGTTWHCNAHLNNFIVSEPKQSEQFLYPLDFDLALLKKEFINIDLESEMYAKNDGDCFQQFMLSEYTAMEMSLSGMEIMNFKYSIEGDSIEERRLEARKMARISFRDSLIQSFRAGMSANMQFKRDLDAQWDSNINQIHSIVQLCLILSGSFQT